MTTELIAGTTSLKLNDDIPVSLNFAIADIKDPSRRNAAFSKTIQLPGSDVNNIFFEHIFEVNASTLNFNPMIKTDCIVLQDGIEVFRGYLRLLEINIEPVNDTQKITYSVAILGENNDLFGAIADDKLQDLDMSSFDHVYNRVNQNASWSAPTGAGYVYPLIDYGYNAFLTNSFTVENFRPAFYVKAYIDKIFAAAGKTYTSSFFTSTFFKRWFIPHNGDRFSMSAVNLALYEFFVGITGTPTSNTKALQSTGSTFSDWWTGNLFTSMSSAYDMVFNDDTTNPFIDSGNRYNTTTGIITIGQSGTYNLAFKTDFEIKLATVPAGTATVNLQSGSGWPISYKVLRSTDGGVTWGIIYNDTPNYQAAVLTTSYQTINKTWSLPTTALNSGDQLRLLIHPLYSASGYGLVFKDGGGTPITAGTASIDWRFRSSATLKESLSVGDYVSGQTLSVNDAIPKDIKQRDFLTSIFKMANLYVDQDPDDVNNYLIEPRNDFYSAGGTKDWSLKLALDKPFVIKTMAEIDVKNFIYRYKSDTDYYNKKYEDLYGEVYGTQKQVVVNDFTQRDDITEVIFSATPIVDNTNNNIIIPKIFSYDGTVVKPQKHNIRVLMYNGTQGNSPTWNYVAPVADALGAAVLPMSTYPSSAMVDDAMNPTETIEFGVPNTVFYTPSTYTTNNIYNRAYYKQNIEVTDKDSRFVTAYFYLRPDDIALFDFRDKIFVKDTLYLVNKISDYNKLKPGLTKVELLKIKDASNYEPTYNIPLSAIETNNNNTSITARYAGSDPNETNIGNSNNVLIGSNNSSRSIGSFISGSRNSVGANSSRVTVLSTVNSNIGSSCDAINLIGCSGVNIGEGCSGILLMNCEGINVADYTYNFTGTNLTGENITAGVGGAVNNCNTTKTGVLSTFEGTGVTI